MAALPSDAQLRAQRMASLLLSDAPGLPGPAERTAASIVEWFGAMQAQDRGSALWSLGVRMPGSTEADVTAAVDSGAVVRTWPMRSTVHLVPAADAKWMVRILGAKQLGSAARRREQLGLEESDALRAGDVLADALAGGKALTRAECAQVLAEADVARGDGLTYHLLWFTSQRGITCSGPSRGKEQTFVLLDEWVREHNDPGREEALAIMALRYFRSHGPATRSDFARWLGLPVADARAGIAGAGADLVALGEGRDPLIVAADAPLATGAAPAITRGALALPGFDEFMLGFKDRDLVLDPAHFEAIVPGRNGVFRPTLVIDGRVAGTWTRSRKAREVQVDVTTLAPVSAARKRSAARAFDAYAAYLGSTADVRWLAPG